MRANILTSGFSDRKQVEGRGQRHCRMSPCLAHCHQGGDSSSPCSAGASTLQEPAQRFPPCFLSTRLLCLGHSEGGKGGGQNKQTAFSIRQHLQLTLAEQLQITPKEARGGHGFFRGSPWCPWCEWRCWLSVPNFLR